MTSHQEILKRYQIEPKKALGQNFLVNSEVLENIASHLDIAGKHVIEVGPGYGALTEHLISYNPASLTLVEYDPKMISILEDRRKRGELKLDSEFELFHKDVLEFSPVRESVVIANIPYYITSPILTRFLFDVEHTPSDMIILMQKEVADKITIGKGYQNSYLSLTLEYACDHIEKLFEVTADNFVPPPKVDSAVVYFRLGNSAWKEKSKQFLRLLSVWFAHPRKKVISNLAGASIATKEELEKVFATLGVRLDARAEMINLEVWQEIAKNLRIN